MEKLTNYWNITWARSQKCGMNADYKSLQPQKALCVLLHCIRPTACGWKDCYASEWNDTAHLTGADSSIPLSGLSAEIDSSLQCMAIRMRRCSQSQKESPATQPWMPTLGLSQKCRTASREHLLLGFIIAIHLEKLCGRAKVIITIIHERLGYEHLITSQQNGAHARVPRDLEEPSPFWGHFSGSWQRYMMP